MKSKFDMNNLLTKASELRQSVKKKGTKSTKQNKSTKGLTRGVLNVVSKAEDAAAEVSNYKELVSSSKNKVFLIDNNSTRGIQKTASNCYQLQELIVEYKKTLNCLNNVSNEIQIQKSNLIEEDDEVSKNYGTVFINYEDEIYNIIKKYELAIGYEMYLSVQDEAFLVEGLNLDEVHQLSEEHDNINIMLRIMDLDLSLEEIKLISSKITKEIKNCILSVYPYRKNIDSIISNNLESIKMNAEIVQEKIKQSKTLSLVYDQIELYLNKFAVIAVQKSEEEEELIDECISFTIEGVSEVIAEALRRIRVIQIEQNTASFYLSELEEVAGRIKNARIVLADDICQSAKNLIPNL